MTRYCFTLQVRPEKLGEYVQRHAAVWPEMLEALQAAGWGEYSLFLRADGLLVGHVVCEDLAQAQAAMARTEVNARWQASMAPFFSGVDGRPADEAFELLPEIFHLPTALAEATD